MINEGLKYHIKNNISLFECIYRPGSHKFFEFFRNARKKLNENYNPDEVELLSTDIGRFGIYEGNSVPLDLPIEAEIIDSLNEAEYRGRKVKLNKPKRGGKKKFYVYVRDPKTKKVKKVSFGAKGMTTGLRDPDRRKSFKARHNCEDKNDKTKPGYWACRIGRYPKVTGAPYTTWW